MGLTSKDHDAIVVMDRNTKEVSMVSKAKTKKVDKLKVVDTKLKVGDLVKWTSYSGGHTKVKTGTISVVMKPNVDYSYLDGISAKFLEDALYRAEFGSRSTCRDYIKTRRIWAAEYAFKLMFRVSEGMYRTTRHYLVVVSTPSGKGKPWLYHPRPDQKFEVISQN